MSLPGECLHCMGTGVIIVGDTDDVCGACIGTGKLQINAMTPIKDKKGKHAWSLMPWDALSSVMDIIMFGAIKYTPRGWESGEGYLYSELFDAAIRHLRSWWLRDPKDPESGLSHLAHAITDILFLLTYEIRELGKDDRPDKPKLKEEK